MKQIRPDLGLSETADHPMGQFHHEVLRPILKLQHPLLIRQFEEWLRGYRRELPREAAARRNDIETVCKTNKRLRAQAFGLIAGLMTESEYDFYLQEQRELPKRTTAMSAKRLADHCDAQGN